MNARHRMDPGTFRHAVESHDLDGMISAFADDARLFSPVSHAPFEGRAAIGTLLGILAEVFQEFRYTDELDATDGTKALIFRARVGDRDVEGLDLLRFDPAGRIRELTVMVRPRSAVEALMNTVGPRLAAVGKG